MKYVIWLLLLLLIISIANIFFAVFHYDGSALAMVCLISCWLWFIVLLAIILDYFANKPEICQNCGFYPMVKIKDVYKCEICDFN